MMDMGKKKMLILKKVDWDCKKFNEIILKWLKILDVDLRGVLIMWGM